MVGALLRNAGVTPRAITYANGTGGEQVVARLVAEKLGFAHGLRERAIVRDDALWQTILDNLRTSDGMLAENRQLAYPLEPETYGVPLFEGHAHQPRGGYAVRFTNDLEQNRQAVLRSNLGDADLVTPALVEERTRQIEDIIGAYTWRVPNDIPYLVYNDIRMSRWLSAAYLSRANQRPVLWPLLDERVLLACAALSNFDRASEFCFFQALLMLERGFRTIPLYKGQWRIDRGGRKKSLFPRGYAARNRETEPPSGKLTPEKTISYVLPLFQRAIRDSRHGDTWQSLIAPVALEAMLGGSPAIAKTDIGGMRAVGFMWKVVAVDTVMSGAWLPARRAVEVEAKPSLATTG